MKTEKKKVLYVQVIWTNIASISKLSVFKVQF